MIGDFKNYTWRGLTLPRQFLVAGAAVMIAASLLVGQWVAQRIEASVVQNSATSAALFMENYISPLSQELAETDTLSQPARQALVEVFRQRGLSQRVVSYKIWLRDGEIVHASDSELIGQRFPVSEELDAAWAGNVASGFVDLDDNENEAEAALGVPLLEVYVPVRQNWTGQVIAVAEIYENASQLMLDLQNARRTSWLVVGGAFFASGVLLFGIVQTGGRTIRRQRAHLKQQLEKTERISAQNANLRKKSVAASARATAQTERAVRRIGSDLHDGPAQYLSLASLRLDAALTQQSADGTDAKLVREALDKALDELRIISRGLALPDLDGLSLDRLIARAVDDHSRQTGTNVSVEQDIAVELSPNYAQKLCIFRFLQETFSNASRHAGVAQVDVKVQVRDALVVIIVSDAGKGFDMRKERLVRVDGGQGLFGLSDRAESIGGQLTIRSALGVGTTVSLTLPFDEASL